MMVKTKTTKGPIDPKETVKKHETSPTDAKEQCSLYLQAFRETSPPQRPSKDG